MKKKPGSKAKAAPRALKDLKPNAADQVKAGRMEAHLNSRSVNPIVIARDRSLNS